MATAGLSALAEHGRLAPRSSVRLFDVSDSFRSLSSRLASLPSLSDDEGLSSVVLVVAVLVVLSDSRLSHPLLSANNRM